MISKAVTYLSMLCIPPILIPGRFACILVSVTLALLAIKATCFLPPALALNLSPLPLLYIHLFYPKKFAVFTQG
jgi:hypothetical protein